MENRSISRISASSFARSPVTGSCRLNRICSVCARSNGPGLTYSSRFTSTVVPRGSSQPDRAGITVAAFGRSPARQW